MILRHNTTPEGAARILGERCVRAMVDRSLGWLFINGPFFVTAHPPRAYSFLGCNSFT